VWRRARCGIGVRDVPASGSRQDCCCARDGDDATRTRGRGRGSWRMRKLTHHNRRVVGQCPRTRTRVTSREVRNRRTGRAGERLTPRLLLRTRFRRCDSDARSRPRKLAHAKTHAPQFDVSSDNARARALVWRRARCGIGVRDVPASGSRQDCCCARGSDDATQPSVADVSRATPHTPAARLLST